MRSKDNMFRRHYQKRRTFLPFVVLRLFLSLAIFVILIGGIYAAYKQFSGVDPKGIDPKALVSGILSSRDLGSLLKIFSVDIKQKQSIIPQANPRSSSTRNQEPASKATLLFKFAIVSDSHNENDFLKKALNQAKAKDSKFVIGLGDYTEVGTIEELTAAKKEFDGAGLRYFVTTGDHDLWDSRDKQMSPLSSFNQVFGPSFQSFSFEGVKFLILDNSDNYTGLSDDQFKWLKFELDRVRSEKGLRLILAFMHEPLYHPSSTRVMGKVTPSLIDQAKNLAKLLKNRGVREVFTGDVHYFTRYNDPQSGLLMTTLGAVNSQRNAQTPRFAIVSIFDDFEFNVEDVEVK